MVSKKINIELISYSNDFPVLILKGQFSIDECLKYPAHFVLFQAALITNVRSKAENIEKFCVENRRIRETIYLTNVHQKLQRHK